MSLKIRKVKQATGASIIIKTASPGSTNKSRSTNNILLSSNNMDWETPMEFFQKVNEHFHFTIDVCATSLNAKCKRYYTPTEDGLAQDWSNEVAWMNPPYGRKIGLWVEKAYSESQKGTTVACLVPARTDTRWWWDYCRRGDIFFLKGRLKFTGVNTVGMVVNNSATFPSALVVFRPDIIIPSVRWGITNLN